MLSGNWSSQSTQAPPSATGWSRGKPSSQGPEEVGLSQEGVSGLTTSPLSADRPVTQQATPGQGCYRTEPADNKVSPNRVILFLRATCISFSSAVQLEMKGLRLDSPRACKHLPHSQLHFSSPQCYLCRAQWSTSPQGTSPPTELPIPEMPAFKHICPHLWALDDPVLG